MDEARERALLAELYASQERERIRAEQNAPDWRVRTRDGPEPPRRTRGLDSAPAQDWSAINRRLASLDDYGRRFVSGLIAEALANERKRLQREVDVLRAMQAETRAQQGELRAALDVVRALNYAAAATKRESSTRRRVRCGATCTEKGWQVLSSLFRKTRRERRPCARRPPGLRTACAAAGHARPRLASCQTNSMTTLGM